MKRDESFTQVQLEFERLRVANPDASHSELWRQAESAVGGGGPVEPYVRMAPLAWISLTLRRLLWVVMLRREHFESLMNDPRSRGQGIAVTVVAGAGVALATFGFDVPAGDLGTVTVIGVTAGAFVSIALLIGWSAVFNGVAKLFGGTHTFRQLVGIAGFSGALYLLNAVPPLTESPVWFGWVVLLAIVGYMIVIQITGLVTVGSLSLPRALAAAVVSLVISIGVLVLFALLVLAILISGSGSL